MSPAGEARKPPRQPKPAFGKGGQPAKKPAHRGQAAPADGNHPRKHKGKAKTQD